MEPTFINLNLLPFTAVLVLIIFSASCFLFFSYLNRKKSKKSSIVLCFFSFILIYHSYCRLVDDAFYLQVQPNDSFDNIISKSKWPFFINYITIENERFIEIEIFPGIIQSILRVISLRSGMPAYVFNIKGEIVAYTIDNLDDYRYQNKWEKYDKKKRISIEEAFKMIKDHGK